MSPAPKKPTKKPNLKAVNTPELEAERNSQVYTGAKAVGTTLVNDAIHFRYGLFEGPDKQHMADFEVAFRTDPILNRALNFIKMTMLASLGDYTHEDPRAKAFVDEMFNTMEGNLLDELGQMIISSLWSGIGVSEKIFEARDGKIWLKRLVNYHPRSLTLVPDRQGRLVDGSTDTIMPTFPKTGIWQHIPSHLMTRFAEQKRRNVYANHIRLPMKKLCILAHNKRHGNHAGESALAPIWLRYQMLLETWQNLMITTERYGSPQVAAIVPKGITSERVSAPTLLDPAATRPKTLAEKTGEQLAQLSATSALVFEEPQGLTSQEKIRLQNISTFNNFGESFLATLNQLYVDILVGVGVPPLLFLEHSGGLGAGAIAQVHAETYKQMITAMYYQFVEPFCEQVIGQLLYLNFGLTDPGKFTFNPFDLAAADTMIKVFAQANEHGILDMSVEEDLQWSRIKLGIPLASTETISKRMKSNSVLMQAVRRPDIDKVKIGEIRAGAQTEGFTRGAETQKHVVKKTTDTQKEIADKNNEAKLQLEKEKAKQQKKLAEQQLRQAEIQNEQIMSGKAGELHDQEASAHERKAAADADAHERKAKAIISVQKAKPAPSAPKPTGAPKPAAPKKPMI